jgi:GNAT superfamily N-acetyltransferase
MRFDDVAPADDIAWTCFEAPGEVRDAAALAGAHARIAHLLTTDPGGAWVVDDESGRVAGAALAILREGVWGLSLLVVRPDLQARGLGRKLLDAALSYGDGARGHIILSSTDPKAMRRYARAGLELRPLVAAAGIVDRSRLPAPSPDVAPSADFAATAPISRAVRGASHHVDVPMLVGRGYALLAHSDRGFAVHDRGTPKLLAALDDEAASALLWACLAAAPPGHTIAIDFISAGQDWAIAAALEAGLALSPDGPLFVSGELGPLRPYLPNGAYL